MPFIVAGAALAAAALVAMPFGRGMLAVVAIALAVFFIAYFVYYSPYYALFPDLVPREEHGRSQGVQGGFRSAGMLLSLVGGGVLLELWEPLPFLAGAIAIFFAMRRRLEGEENRGGEDSGATSAETNWKADWELVRDNRNIRVWVIANAMWEAGIGALRAFVVLYFTEGLGLSLYGAAGALALVGVAAMVAAPLSGKLADRYGHRPVLLWSTLFFGLGLLPPLFTTNHYFLAGIVPVAFAAVVLITLPYSVLMGFLPEEQQHGAGAALFSFSRGGGIVLGAMLAGIAAELLRGVNFLTFGQTQGYAAIFLVASAFLLASSPLLFKMDIEGRGEG
jgi:predicted MFS family arabinose efflux permease